MRWVAPVAIIFIILQQSKLIDIDAYFSYKPVEETEKVKEPSFSFPGLDPELQEAR
jgi:hypothetical protein